jgi:hypothetical protein
VEAAPRLTPWQSQLFIILEVFSEGNIRFQRKEAGGGREEINESESMYIPMRPPLRVARRKVVVDDDHPMARRIDYPSQNGAVGRLVRPLRFSYKRLLLCVHARVCLSGTLVHPSAPSLSWRFDVPLTR